jgi:hypothetical protein
MAASHTCGCDFPRPALQNIAFAAAFMQNKTMASSISGQLQYYRNGL